MSNAQRVNKHQRTKTNRRTTTKGARGRRNSVFNHGLGKGQNKINDRTKKKRIAK